MFSFHSHYGVFSVSSPWQTFISTDTHATPTRKPVLLLKNLFELVGNSTKGHYWVSSKCIAKFVISVYLAQTHILIRCKCQHHEWHSISLMVFCECVCMCECREKKKVASLDALNLCIDLRCIQSNRMAHLWLTLFPVLSSSCLSFWLQVCCH